MRQLRKLSLAILLTLIVAAVWTAPRAIDHRALAPELPENLDRWLADSEARVATAQGIVAGAEKRIRWIDDATRQATPLAVVYLHGFSATRQEVAPLGERLADALGANLFETRLSGHGLLRDALTDVRAEQWLDDATEALAVGASIGERVIVVGTSTGATLALAIADHPVFANVAGVILISPNFAPKDSAAEILTWPGGPQLASMLVGETRSWTAANELQARYWTTTYPMAAAIEMMRLVKFTRNKLPLTLAQPLLTLYSPNDQVIDTERLESALARIDSPRMKIVRVPASGDPSNHVLAGDILAAENNAAVLAHMLEFLQPLSH